VDAGSDPERVLKGGVLGDGPLWAVRQTYFQRS